MSKYKTDTEKGLKKPLTVLLDPEPWDIVLQEKSRREKLMGQYISYSDVINDLILKGGAKK